MELHVWMLMIRYVAEGKPGLEIRSSMVEAMWADVNKRKNKLKVKIYFFGTFFLLGLFL